ncbi:MAG TPA: hypothetical protein VF691_09570, partial [Cytophagaceae bacterium]
MKDQTDLPTALDKMQHKLQAREEAGNLRTLKINKGLVDFYSNDYLGLAKDASLLSASQQMLGSNANINGSSGSRLLSGNSEQSVELERYLANY